MNSNQINMNNLVKLLAIIIFGISGIVYQSCDKNDDPTLEDIVGTWKLTEVSTNDGVSFSFWTLQTTTATFNENGTYSGKGYFGNGSGTWKQSGKTIITYVDGSEYLRYEVKELTSTTCTLVISMTGSDSTLWIKCVKQ